MRFFDGKVGLAIPLKMLPFRTLKTPLFINDKGGHGGTPPHLFLLNEWLKWD